MYFKMGGGGGEDVLMPNSELRVNSQIWKSGVTASSLALPASDVTRPLHLPNFQYVSRTKKNAM
jgi:hypothetical protein